MKKTILLSALFSIAASFFAYSYLSGIEAKYKTMAEPVSAVVAKKRITPGIVIKKEMLEEKLVPKEYAQPKSFSKAGSLFSKDSEGLYSALVTIEAGEQILATKVSRIDEESGIANIIPQGQKALAVNFDNTSAKVIAPGSRIDVLSIIEYADNNKQIHEAVYMVAQDILVLFSGGKYIGAPKKKNDDSSQENDGIITLSVTVEQAQTILLAGERGKLKYIIRPAGDVQKHDVKPLKISDIIKDISLTAPQTRYSKDSGRSQKEVLEFITKYAASSNR
ncbi:MAG: Flp pilus assembly protein CpaB [Endomicrobium sp.]|jgi:pilus assembly protein CpaB|nr:Flp pilus assembly protein CpaB [Endomicrobium sp.]